MSSVLTLGLSETPGPVDTHQLIVPRAPRSFFQQTCCLVFSKYFFLNMGFLYTPSIQWPMEAYSNGNKRYVYDTELKLHKML